MHHVLSLIAAGFALAMPLAAQETKTATVADPNPRRGDIVVEALLPQREKPPTTLEQATNDSLKNRVVYENSARVARCIIKLAPQRLRDAIDGDMNSASQREAQAWLIRRTVTCNADTQVIRRPHRENSSSTAQTVNQVRIGNTSSDIGGFGSSTTQLSVEGRSIYDRGALLEELFAKFLPDLALSQRETRDAAVQGRLNLMETARNRLRLEEDYRYFEVAICMVRLQPGLAVRMMRTHAGSAMQRRLQSAIISNARVCVGNAQHVYVDPSQFRAYIADSLYRWVVAARGVKSLIPSRELSAPEDM